jgi:hypothetical protein
MRRKTHPKNNVPQLAILGFDRRRLPAPRCHTDGLSILELRNDQGTGRVESDSFDLLRVDFRLAKDITGSGGDAVPDCGGNKRLA